MSPQPALFQQLLSHFKECYKCLLSYVKVINVLQYDPTPKEINFIQNYFGFMSDEPRAANER